MIGKRPFEGLASYDIDTLNEAYEVTINRIFLLMEALAEALAEAQQNAKTIDRMRSEAPVLTPTINQLSKYEAKSDKMK